jgi:hypothetical protein
MIPVIVCSPVPETGMYRLMLTVIIRGVEIYRLFEWDGASIPRFFWRAIGSPFQPKFMVPSLWHDFVYGQKKLHCGLTREEADLGFKELLLESGVDEDLAETLWAGVRAGGGSHWD